MSTEYRVLSTEYRAAKRVSRHSEDGHGGPLLRGTRYSLLGVGLMAALALLVVACDGSGAALSNVTKSAETIVPGSSGIGKPPGALEIRYTLDRKALVSAQLQGPAGGTLLSAEQEAGEHTL